MSGLKAEDTFVTGPDGMEVLTSDERWPALEIAGRPRPAILER